MFWSLYAVSPSSLLRIFLYATVLSAVQSEEITFSSDKLVLHSITYRPEGEGPFSAVLYNHGSEANPGTKPELGKFFSSKGYVFFFPLRRGQGCSPDDSYVKSLRVRGAAGAIALHETHLEDQLAALTYLKRLPYVDARTIPSPAALTAAFKPCSLSSVVEAITGVPHGMRKCPFFFCNPKRIMIRCPTSS
jgi:cephalosporin-C deacetylase-like acetyl esterase